MIPAVFEIMLIAIAVSLGTSFVNKKIINQDRMDEIKKQISDFQKRYNEVKKSGDEEKIKEMTEEQKKMMGLTKEMMINSFKPMAITIVPVLVIFYFLSNNYGNLGNIVRLPVLNWDLSWFWWYIIIAVLTSIIVEIIYKQYRKAKKKKQQ